MHHTYLYLFTILTLTFTKSNQLHQKLGYVNSQFIPLINSVYTHVTLKFLRKFIYNNECNLAMVE